MLGLALTALALPCLASEAADAPPATPLHELLAVDFDSIPTGVLPPMPSADGAPPPVAEDLADGLSLEKVKLPPPRKRPKLRKAGRKVPPGLAAKTIKSDAVKVMPDHAEIGALYVPDAAGTEFSGESVSPLMCQKDQAGTSPLRWETLSVSGDSAEIDVKDLWFQGATCSVTAGTSARKAFGAIASHGSKPWLYAMHDDRSVTFLFPRATDVTVDAIVGAPVTVQGGFTRVTLPLGRWGATSFVAHLPSLDIDAPAPAPARQPKGQAVRPRPQPPQPSTDPVEIGVELVQTMSEKNPTLLIRCGAQEATVTQRDRD